MNRMKKLFKFLRGEKWPSLQMIRNGYRYEIVRRGRVIVHAKGPHGISWADAELKKPMRTVPQVEEWQLRIERANAICEKWRLKSQGNENQPARADR